MNFKIVLIMFSCILLSGCSNTKFALSGFVTEETDIYYKVGFVGPDIAISSVHTDILLGMKSRNELLDKHGDDVDTIFGIFIRKDF